MNFKDLLDEDGQAIISDTVCLDGKYHNWKYIGSSYNTKSLTHEDRWCSKCGSMTEFTDRGRCVDGDNYYIRVPEELTLNYDKPHHTEVDD